MLSFSKQQRICHLFCGFHARHCFMQAFVVAPMIKLVALLPLLGLCSAAVILK
jgi:hypothetical protein